MEQWLDQLPAYEPTPEDIQAERERLEALIAEQRQHLPDWWWDEDPT